MEDQEIIRLYQQRDPNAIQETASKYGAYCKAIAKNIVGNEEDAEECVNDAYWRAWNSIPPNRPRVLSAYLGKITRNLSFDRFRSKCAHKRGGAEVELALEELEECVSGIEDVEQTLDKQELIGVIDAFLDTLPREKCRLFLCRYWYALPVSEIALRFGMTETNVSVTLHRIRGKLKQYLMERGYQP